MTPGALLLRFRQKWGKGLAVAYWRDWVRPKILHAAPICDNNDSTCEIHCLTCAGDWLNLIWALYSFYKISNRHYKLCIHEDGSLGPEAKDHLRRLFPLARLIERADADQAMQKILANHPHSAKYRNSNNLAIKVFDFFHYLEAERMFLFDSDLLFFATPEVLLTRIENTAYKLNSENRDMSTAYTVSTKELEKHLRFAIIEQFNSGLALIHKQSYDLDLVETALQIPGFLSHFWRIEQTIFAILSSRFGVEHLPSEYDVRLGKGMEGLPSRHYVGAIRHLFYSEGIRYLYTSSDLLRGGPSLRSG